MSVAKGFAGGFGGCFGVVFAIILMVVGVPVGCVLLVSQMSVVMPKGSATDESKKPSAAATESTPAPKKLTPASPVDARNGVIKSGDVRVWITGVNIGPVPLKDFRDTQSQKDLLMISLTVSNGNAKKIVDYRGWATAAEDFLDQDRATLKDNADNVYKRCHFGFGTHVVGQVHGNTSVYPNKSVSDILVFEPPTDACEYLILDLPLAAVGQDGHREFKIPRSMWTKEPSTTAESQSGRPNRPAAEESREDAVREFNRSLPKDPEDGKQPAGDHATKLPRGHVFSMDPPALEKREARPTEFRTWTDASGTFTIEAAFVGQKGPTVTLKKRDGSEVKLSIFKLSDADREWLRTTREAAQKQH